MITWLTALAWINVAWSLGSLCLTCMWVGWLACSIHRDHQERLMMERNVAALNEAIAVLESLVRRR